MSTHTVRAITALLRDRPRPDLSAKEFAAWQERKAAVFDQIAAEDPTLAIEARELAASARARAADLRAAETRRAG